MVVNFTANIGLAKPTESEVAENWVNTSELQEDNNLIIIDKTDIGFQTYVPVIKAQTTDPTIGSGGGQFGDYQDIEGFIIGRFLISFFGSGITAGSGEYGISLPAVADATFHNVGTTFNSTPGPHSIIGEGYITDDSAVATSGSVALDVVTVGGVSYARLLTELFTAPAKTSQLVRDAMPFTVAASDIFSGNFCYKKA